MLILLHLIRISLKPIPTESNLKPSLNPNFTHKRKSSLVSRPKRRESLFHWRLKLATSTNNVKRKKLNSKLKLTSMQKLPPLSLKPAASLSMVCKPKVDQLSSKTVRSPLLPSSPRKLLFWSKSTSKLQWKRLQSSLTENLTVKFSRSSLLLPHLLLFWLKVVLLPSIIIFFKNFSRIIDLFDSLLDKIEDALNLERFSEEKKVEAYNKARRLLVVSINVTESTLADITV